MSATKPGTGNRPGCALPPARSCDEKSGAGSGRSWRSGTPPRPAAIANTIPTLWPDLLGCSWCAAHTLRAPGWPIGWGPPNKPPSARRLVVARLTALPLRRVGRRPDSVPAIGPRAARSGRPGLAAFAGFGGFPKASATGAAPGGPAWLFLFPVAPGYGTTQIVPGLSHRDAAGV